MTAPFRNNPALKLWPSSVGVTKRLVRDDVSYFGMVGFRVVIFCFNKTLLFSGFRSYLNVKLLEFVSVNSIRGCCFDLTLF